MRKYVQARDGAASPQPAPPGKQINPDRQARAANAKISISKKTPDQQPQKTQALSGGASHRLGYSQNSSATIQHPTQRNQLSQVQKIDLYDTDAESIDTTVNQSVIQVEDIQEGYPQYHQRREGLQHGDAFDEDEDESGEEEEGDDENDNFEFSPEEIELLRQKGVDAKHVSTDYAMAILQQHRPSGFRTVDGDSYPTTTEGDPNEWEGMQEPPSEYRSDNVQGSLSPQHLTFNGRGLRAAPPLQRGKFNQHVSQPMQGSKDIVQRSAQLRDQQRVNNYGGQQFGQDCQSNPTPFVPNQPTTYTRISPESAPTLHRATLLEAQRTFPPQHHGPPNAVKSDVPTKHSSSARNKVVPAIRYPTIEVNQGRETVVHLDGDYDLETLHTMNYEQLKNESFDIIPRGITQPLTGDMLEKPLNERLSHVKNFETNHQMQFFRSLPITEWEDAGDWFLDQFNSIIKRTKEARKIKRKLAQGFEDEIEKRHVHVSKRQHQAEAAMNKMKAQGERLVPKSPRASKSPKSKKRSK
ncbi:extracellular mutant protein 11-domain-containing protein [Phaeosphaeriaceae sp. PMI808]|nr:extracellular mutant protein 11-domain-containing protein [Phaeosphaeriaceae sp. PMI808]